MTIPAADPTLRSRPRLAALVAALVLAWTALMLAGATPARAASCPGALSDPYSSAVLSDGPVAYYRLDEASGLTMCDSSPSANSGTYAGSGIAYGQAGALTAGPDASVASSGSSTAVGQSGANSPITGNHSFTLEGWYRSTTAQNQILVDIGNPPGTQTPGDIAGLALWRTNGNDYGNSCATHASVLALDEYYGYNCWDTTAAGVNLFDGKWHYVSIAYDAAADTVTGDADGHTLTAQHVTASMNLNASPVRVGRWIDTLVNQPFIGGADDVAVYPTALPASRSAAHYAAGTTKPGTSVSTTVGCNLSADTEIDTCIATVVDTSTPPATPTTPTGTVSFTSDGGGVFTAGSTCTLSPIPGGGASASCSVTFAPSANSLPNLTAVYSGDASHPASTGATNIPGFVSDTTDLRQAVIIACSTIYVAPCAGLVPAPGPVTVCVSGWQNCNGFGGRKPANPGTLDLSGLPKSVSTPVSCSGSSPKATRARSHVDPPGGSGPSSSSSATCSVLDYMNDQSEDRNSTDDSYNRTARAVLYVTQLNALRDDTIGTASKMIAEYTDPSRWGGKSPPRTLIGLLVAAVRNTQNAFFNANEKDNPVVTDVVVAVPEGCDVLADAELHEICVTVLTSIQDSAVRGLQTLAGLKHTLQLDGTQPDSNHFVRDALGAQGAATKSKRHYAHVATLLASGKITLAKGKKGKLVLHLTKLARKQLRTLKRHGVRKVTATMHLLIRHQGIVTTKTFKVTLVLLRPKTRAHRR